MQMMLLFLIRLIRKASQVKQNFYSMKLTSYIGKNGKNNNFTSLPRYKEVTFI